MPDDAGAGRPAANQRPRGLPRIADIARLSGASTATVDRVLNQRPGVRAATVQRVLKAAAELDYLPESALSGALAPKPFRVVYLLPGGTNRYLAMLGQLIRDAEAALSPLGLKAQVELVKSFNPELLARSLLQHRRKADGIAFMALEHPAVREAVNELAERNVPTVTVITDIQNCRRVAYVGLDNRAAGRTAGFLIGRFVGHRPAKVAMIAGSLSYRAHEERELGFLHYLNEEQPGIDVLGLREAHDDERESYRQMRTLLSHHPDLSAVYNIGGAPGGVAKALKEARRERDVVFVGHGLTAETRALLIDGTMDALITSDPRHVVMDSASVFANLKAERPALQGLEPLRCEVIFRENLPQGTAPASILTAG